MVSKVFNIWALAAAFAVLVSSAAAQQTQPTQKPDDPSPQTRPDATAQTATDQDRGQKDSTQGNETFESFDPSVDISTDNAVSFPTDI